MLDIVVWCLTAVLLTATERSDPWWVLLVLESQRGGVGGKRPESDFRVKASIESVLLFRSTRRLSC